MLPINNKFCSIYIYVWNVKRLYGLKHLYICICKLFSMKTGFPLQSQPAIHTLLISILSPGFLVFLELQFGLTLPFAIASMTTTMGWDRYELNYQLKNLKFHPFSILTFQRIRFHNWKIENSTGTIFKISFFHTDTITYIGNQNLWDDISIGNFSHPEYFAVLIRKIWANEW